MNEYDEKYYKRNSQDRDRPALWFYYRIWKRYCRAGSVLDFGSGVGHLSRRLSKTAKTYSLEINAYAAEQLASVAPLAQVISQTGTLATGSIGSITALHVLEHLTDAEVNATLLEFYRVLEPAGRVLAVMPERGEAANQLKGGAWMGFSDSTHINLKPHGEWIKQIEDLDLFQIERVFADGYYDFPYGKNPLKNIAEALRTVFQFVLGVNVLSPGDGEATIYILRKFG